MGLEDDVRAGIKKGLEDYDYQQTMKARAADRREAFAGAVASSEALRATVTRIAEEYIQKGKYPEAVRVAWNDGSHWSSHGHIGYALWEWGKACEQGSEKYPKDAAKALELMKGAAWWNYPDARVELKRRGIKFSVMMKNKLIDAGARWLAVIEIGLLAFFLVTILFKSWMVGIIGFVVVSGFAIPLSFLWGNEEAVWPTSLVAGLGLSLLVSNLFDLQSASFLSRWLIRIVVFVVGCLVPVNYYTNVSETEKAGLKGFSFSLETEPLRLYPRKRYWKRRLVEVWLVIALLGWASWIAPQFLPIDSYYKRSIFRIVEYYKG